MPTYPIDLPATPVLKSVRYRSVAINSMNRNPFSGSQQIYTYGGGWWEVEALLPPLPDFGARTWSAALQSLNGLQGSFNLVDPAHPQPDNLANVTGGPFIWHPTSQFWNGNAVFMYGWQASKPTLQVGDWFTIQNVPGLYRCQVNGSADASGITWIEFWPTLRAPAWHTWQVNLVNPKGIFRLKTNDGAEWQWDEGRIAMGLTFQAMEAF